MTSLLLSLSLAGPLAGALAASPPPPPDRVASVERGRYLMGTLCTAVAEHPDRAVALAALTAALDEIDRLESVMSGWREDSEIAGLNRLAGAKPATCSADLAAVLDSALVLARQTEGAFDPTVLPLMDAWDLRGKGRVPDAAALAAARARVGWQGLDLDRNARTVRFARADMAVDLGGIGKGFALEKASTALARGGVRRALLNLGGEAMALGDRHTIAVAHPADRLVPAIELEVGDACVSTSGQSERGFTVGGARYGHVLDPRAGRPVTTAGSVTVVCRSATRADALATALLVMGRERASAVAREHSELGVLWLEPAGSAVRAWCWNLPSAHAAPGAVVRWMNQDHWTTHTLEKGRLR